MSDNVSAFNSHEYNAKIRKTIPYYVWILVNALYFIIPAIVMSVIGFIMKKKQ